MLGHELLVHAWAVVEALEVGRGHELEQVAVPGLVPGEQREVVVLLLALAGVAIEPRARRDVGLDADDRLDAGLPGRLEEAQRAEHRSVVGDGDRGHAEALRLSEDRGRPGVRRGRFDASGAVEQGVLGVHVEVDEAVAAVGHVRCASSLRGGLSTASPAAVENYTGVIRAGTNLRPAREVVKVAGRGPARRAPLEVVGQGFLDLDALPGDRVVERDPPRMQERSRRGRGRSRRPRRPRTHGPRGSGGRSRAGARGSGGYVRCAVSPRGASRGSSRSRTSNPVSAARPSL